MVADPKSTLVDYLTNARDVSLHEVLVHMVAETCRHRRRARRLAAD